MVQDKTFGMVELDTKQFSGAMVIALIIHVGILRDLFRDSIILSQESHPFIKLSMNILLFLIV